MKVRIFNRQNGWYIPIRNYKNSNESPFYLNVYFSQKHCPEPSYIENNDGYCSKNIIVNEGSFNKYINNKGDLKISLTVFDYETLEDIEIVKDDTGMFGHPNNIIDAKDLPFY